MGIPTTFVFTHDSIGVGEDGPTHQPIEHLASLRAMPNLWVIRPADANETNHAWRMALERKDGPVLLALTRQALPVLAGAGEGALKGGYVLSEAAGARAVIVATGSEVSLALEAQAALAREGIAVRVVSLPCWEVFETQPEDYRASVLPKQLPTVSIEAGSTLGWERYAARCIGLDRFGASAPFADIYKNLGFTVERVVGEVKGLLP
jgi:transketolase